MTRPLKTQSQLARALAVATAREPPVLHVCRERDVGLFSLVQQAIANVPWALQERRIPVADFGERTCYWTPAGRHGARSVWEYYFEPLVDGFPAAAIPKRVSDAIEQEFPDQNEVGRAVGDHAYVSNQFGDHPRLARVAPRIPYVTGNPGDELRAWTSAIIRSFVRPRPYVERLVESFVREHLTTHDVIGVHVRGTDAVSSSETRAYRRGSLDLRRYVVVLGRMLKERPGAKVFVATDAEASLEHLVGAFGDRVIAYDAVRHRDGEVAAVGPTGCIMPAYVAADRDRAAQNGEDAVVEYLLLSRCRHLVHNGASLAMTVLLKEPSMPHTNTHVGA